MRKTALAALELSKYTLEKVIERVKDASEEVRKQSFSILSQRIPVDKLTKEQRNFILKEGVLDRYFADKVVN